MIPWHDLLPSPCLLLSYKAYDPFCARDEGARDEGVREGHRVGTRSSLTIERIGGVVDERAELGSRWRQANAGQLRHGRCDLEL
jgi:hypothetical protein